MNYREQPEFLAAVESMKEFDSSIDKMLEHLEDIGPLMLTFSDLVKKNQKSMLITVKDLTDEKKCAKFAESLATMQGIITLVKKIANE